PRQSHRVADLVPQGRLERGAHVENGCRNGGADTGGDQRIFDRGRAVLVGAETPREPRKGTRYTSHQPLAPRYADQEGHSSVVRCATSGTSAGGIGYSRSRFGRTQASPCPSFALTVPSHRRHT